MQSIDLYILRGKCLISLSACFLLLSIYFMISPSVKIDKEAYVISYEYINIKDMATASVATKTAKNDSVLTTLISPKELKETTLELISTSQEGTEEITEVAMPLLNNTEQTLDVPKQIWYLPVENGIITSTPNYYHVAYDITSPRGSNEPIFPVANGTISGIYSDNAGAKIVTIHHVVNGINYTSQYVHLSSYAPDLYVGREVTINDYIGMMGTTGISTGVHLHLAVVDCTLFDPNDANCSDLNGFFRYASARYSQGFTGLGNLMNVPWNWTGR